MKAPLILAALALEPNPEVTYLVCLFGRVHIRFMRQAVIDWYLVENVQYMRDD